MSNKKEKLTICRLKRIFKQFAKEQFKENEKSNIKIYKRAIERFPENIELSKRDFEETQRATKDSYLEKIGYIECGTTEKLLKHLGIIQNNKLKTSNLETALKTIRLLINFSENHDDLIFFWNGIEIQLKQVNSLHRIIRNSL